VISPFSNSPPRSTADPAGLGYAAFIAAHDRVGLANLMNTPNAAFQVKRTDITPQDVLEAIDIRDLAYPNVSQVAAANQPLVNSYFESFTQLARVRFEKDDGTDTTILKNLKLVLVGVGQGSQARVIALSTRAGGRAEFLWGVSVTEQNIATPE
jgi:hypothetical protein